ncbi:DsbA family oxidoreductase [Cupriavidus sp. UYPR2.512]|uniref:DsbA family oxidoreductase n=1 Tax=Cupriavidus sp. UYPR2.512 TaxID=1080187 RepID=UPI000372B282|nr:DsbA family oxidoreductase [Cupriavidus sp. UYPR2.512]UIF91571.1 DsbA family oxidoreductase [Cupriavidus necator]
MNQPASLFIQVGFDLVCPWCMIGKRHLETALAQLATARPDVVVTVEWRSCPLFPTLPPAGIPYRKFSLARLGSAEAVALRQAQVCAAAREAGITLEPDRIEVLPSTVLAHRLIRYARQTGGEAAASALIDRLFERYFLCGEDLGDPRVLHAAAIACGTPMPQAAAPATAQDLAWLPPLHGGEVPLPSPGLGVPRFVINGAPPIAGARPPRALLEAMLRALARASPASSPPPGIALTAR